jgi:hypothetical protein
MSLIDNLTFPGGFSPCLPQLQSRALCFHTLTHSFPSNSFSLTHLAKLPGVTAPFAQLADAQAHNFRAKGSAAGPAMRRRTGFAIMPDHLLHQGFFQWLP